MANKIKSLRTTAIVNKDSGTHFKKVVKEWRDEHRNNWMDASKRIEELLRVSIDGFANFIDASDFSDLKEVEEVMGNLNKYVTAGNNTWRKMTSEWYKLEQVKTHEIDHHEFSRISLRLRVIYQGFVEIIEELQDTGEKVLKQDRMFISTLFIKKEVPIRQIIIAKEKVRRLLMMAVAMNHPDLELNMRSSSFPNTYSAIITTVKTWISETSQDQWEAIKEKQVDVINGKVGMDIKVASKEYNSLIKGEAELAVGGALYNVFQQSKGDILSDARKGKTKFSRLKGSEKRSNKR